MAAVRSGENQVALRMSGDLFDGMNGIIRIGIPEFSETILGQSVNSIMLTIEAWEEIWPLIAPFRISRGSRTEAQVVFVTVSDGEHTGHGECVPIKRYGQSIQSVIAQIDSIKRENNLDRQRLQKLLPASATRNALDCALWDLEAKISGKRVWELASVPVISEVVTSFT